MTLNRRLSPQNHLKLSEFLPKTSAPLFPDSYPHVSGPQPGSPHPWNSTACSQVFTVTIGISSHPQPQLPSPHSYNTVRSYSPRSLDLTDPGT